MKLLALAVVTLFLASPALAQQIPPAPKGAEEAQRERLDMMMRILDLERQLNFYIEREIKAQRDQVHKQIEDKAPKPEAKKEK